jgi:hypothetical protein
LRSVRAQIHELWGKASAHNRENPVPDDATRVLFYFGPLITDGDLSS